MSIELANLEFFINEKIQMEKRKVLITYTT